MSEFMISSQKAKYIDVPAACKMLNAVTVKIISWVSGYHVDTLNLAKAVPKVKAIWPSH